ncbi:MAG TPA: hypothetical protein VFU46_06325 [Gemmatimonadales bacterium]|nr:hypothetical protein [Gemmatimonadales bacterium]
MRRGPAGLAVVSALAGHRRVTRDELDAYQGRLLRRLVRHAYTQVPYYRMLFDRHGLRPDAVRGLADLPLIPISAKDDLRRQRPAAVVARDRDPERLIPSGTSGSTGHPFTVRRTWLEQNLLHLFRLRALRQVGVRAGDRFASIGRQRTPDRRDNKLIGRALHALGIRRRARFDIGLPAAELAERMARLGPDVVSGYAGTLAHLAGHLLDRADTRVRPRLVLTGAEVLTVAMRRLVEQAFAAPVFDFYGSFEFDLLAWECPAGGPLHVCDDGLILEVLVDGRPAREGEAGEVVATNLHAYAMPFIRYRLGDLVTRGPAACPCGSPFSTIREVRGRMVDHLLLPDGRTIHPYQLSWPLIRKSGLPIRQHQLVQERPDRIVMRVVMGPEWPSGRIPPVPAEVSELLGRGVEFRVEPVEEIRCEPSGKYRVARSLVRSAYDEPAHEAAPGEGSRAG